MAISRHDRRSNFDWSWRTAIPEIPQLDYKALEETMANVQHQTDLVGQIPQQKPNVLQSKVDPALYQEYQKMVTEGADNVTKTFTEEGLKAGLAAQNKYLNDVKKQWQPGGLAHTLNTRYNTYQEHIKNIEEFQKKDSRGVNSQLAKLDLQKSIDEPINYNADLGTFTNIKTPELSNDPDLRKAVDEMLKEIKASGTTSFLGDFDKDWWIQKIQKEGRSEKQIELAFEALSSQPEFQAQLGRDAKFKSYSVNPDTYKADFEEKQRKGLARLESSSEEAKKDKSKTLQWQNLLISEGYNITPDGDFDSLTENATKEYLDKKRTDVKDAVSKFDFNTSLQEDVKNDYLGYALRGAYSKTDIDPFFNQAIKAKMDIAQKNKELDLASKRLELEFAPPERPGSTVVSGVGAQLPELDKIRSQAKEAKVATEKQLNETLAKSDTFRGWKIENVGAAYSKWTQAKGGTEYEKKQDYKRLLNENGTHQFTDAEVDNLYKEMNAPRDQSSLQTILGAYNEVDQTAQRFESAKLAVASQYLDLPEGKAAMQDLRSSAPKSFQNLSDKELAQKALQEPQLFEISSTAGSTPSQFGGSGSNQTFKVNPADKFNRVMNSDAEKLSASGTNFTLGDAQTYEVYADPSDKVLRPLLDGLKQGIETGTGNNFQSFGAMGLTFKDKGGVELKGVTKKVENMGIALNEKREPILKVDVKVTNNEGKTKDGYTEVNLSPGSPESRQAIKSLKSTYMQMVNSGDVSSAYGVLDIIQALEGKDKLKYAAIDLQKSKLDLNNTYNQGIHHYTENKELVDIGRYGNKTIDLHDDEIVAGLKFKTLGVNTPSGNKLLNVLISDNGTLVAVPHDNGGIYYNSASEISRDRLGRAIQHNTPVEVKETKK